MRISRLIIVITASLVVAIAGTALLGPRLAIDASRYERGFEAAASDILDLEVTVHGRFALAFAGDVLFVAEDVHARRADGNEVLKVDRATVGLGLLPLLFDQRRVRRIELVRPSLVVGPGPVWKGVGGRGGESKRALPALAGARLSVEDGTLEYRDDASGAVFHATDVDARGRASDRHLVVDPIALRLFGAGGRATFRADLSDSVPRFDARAAFSDVPVAECLRTVSPDTIATGTVDLAANFSSRGRTAAERMRNLQGEVIVEGRELLLPRVDLDQQFSRFAASQSLDLMDVGSVLLVGPLGIAVTKGFDFARLLGGSGGTTRVSAIVSSWDVRNGALDARDVAMATPKHRLALTGRLDFVSQRFDSVFVALVDEDGCATIRQEIRGTFGQPVLTRPGVLSALLGPARSVVAKAKEILPGSCTEFYLGSIPHPRG